MRAAPRRSGRGGFETRDRPARPSPTLASPDRRLISANHPTVSTFIRSGFIHPLTPAFAGVSLGRTDQRSGQKPGPALSFTQPLRTKQLRTPVHDRPRSLLTLKDLTPCDPSSPPFTRRVLAYVTATCPWPCSPCGCLRASHDRFSPPRAWSCDLPAREVLTPPKGVFFALTPPNFCGSLRERELSSHSVGQKQGARISFKCAMEHSAICAKPKPAGMTGRGGKQRQHAAQAGNTVRQQRSLGNTNGSQQSGPRQPLPVELSGGKPWPFRRASCKAQIGAKNAPMDRLQRESSVDGRRTSFFNRGGRLVMRERQQLSSGSAQAISNRNWGRSAFRSG